LNDPDAFRPLGRAAEAMVAEKYSLEAVLPQMLKMYEDARHVSAGLEPKRNESAGPLPVKVEREKQAKPTTEIIDTKPDTPASKSPFATRAKKGIQSTDVIIGKSPPRGWSPFRG